MSKTTPPRRVLLIDDSLTVRIFVDAVLSNAGYQVETAADGIAGLEALARMKPDLILLDMRLPGADTVALADAIHERDVGNDTIVLLYTGQPAPNPNALLTRYGAHGYLRKTHDPEHLLQAVADAWHHYRRK